MASGRIKGITIEIDGNTTKLTDSLKAVDKQLSNTQKNLKDLNRLLKLDPGNTELIVQKQRNLSGAIESTEARLKELKQVQKENVTPEQWDALQREIVATEQELKALKKEYSGFGSVAGQKLQVAGGKIKEFGGKVTSAGRALMPLSLALTGVGVKAVSSFAEVDKTMTLTNKTMGNTAEEAELLSDAMKSAAANSTFGMSDAAEATLNFARAGLNAEEAAAALAPAMNLAAGEGGNLDTVSAGLVATINGFGGSFEDAGKYADVFANACNNSALDIDSLSDSMSIAAPVFSAAGYSVNDAALYMGVMANAGIDASTAANALKTGFARLVSPTDEAAGILDDLGVSVVNADGTMKDSVTIQKELHDAFAGLSESEQIAAASTIFGKTQMSNWLALINTAPTEVDSLSSSLDQNGTTTEMAASMMSGFGGSLEKLKSSIDVAITSLGEALAPAISVVADAVQGAVNWFNGLDESQQQLIATIGLVVAAIGPVLTIFGPIISGVGSVISTVGSLMSAIGATGLIGSIGGLVTSLGPLLAGGAVVAGVVAGGIAIYSNWDTIKEKAGQLWDGISSAFDSIKSTVSSVWEDVKTNTSNAWENVKSGVSEAAENVKTGVTKAWNTIKTTTSTTWATVKTGVTTTWNGLKTSAKTGFDNIKTTVTNVWNNLKTNTGTAWNTIKTGVNTAWTGLKTGASTTFTNIKTTVTNAWTTLKTNTATSWNTIKTGTQQAWDNVKSKITTSLTNAKTSVGTILGNMKTTVSSALTRIKNSIGNPFSKLAGFARTALSSVKSAFSNIKLSLPNVKLPHFNVSWRNLGPVSIPSISVSWYRKAYNNPMMFTRPTVLQTPAGPKGFGDGHGAEIVLGINKLRELVGSTNSQTTINVYAQPGMNIKQLATEIQNRLAAVERQKQRVWA